MYVWPKGKMFGSWADLCTVFILSCYKKTCDLCEPCGHKFSILHLPASPIELKMFSVTSRMRSVASPWRPMGWAPLAYCLMC